MPQAPPSFFNVMHVENYEETEDEANSQGITSLRGYTDIYSNYFVIIGVGFWTLLLAAAAIALKTVL